MFYKKNYHRNHKKYAKVFTLKKKMKIKTQELKNAILKKLSYVK